MTLSFPKNDILPNNLIHHFIRGYFDGDGGVHYGESTVYNKARGKEYLQFSYSCYFSGNQQFLLSIKQILEQNYIQVSKIYNDNRSNNYQIFIYGKENIEQFQKYIYNEQTISLSRKLDKFSFVQNCKDLKINQ